MTIIRGGSGLHFKVGLCLLIPTLIGLNTACSDAEQFKNVSYSVYSDCPSATQTSGTLYVEKLGKSGYLVKGATAFAFPDDFFSIAGPHLLESRRGSEVCKSFIYGDVRNFAFFGCDLEGGDRFDCSITMDQ